MNILITGASGFIGKRLISHLSENYKQLKLFPVVRKSIGDSNEIVISSILDLDWSDVLRNKDIVIHLAGIAHEKNNNDELKKVNTTATMNLYTAAQKSGVSHFIFMSTIGVNGLFTKGSPFLVSDNPNPLNAYSISKYEAERFITENSYKSKMTYSIVRAPLIYGRNAKGTFESLLNLFDTAVPLPFAKIKNKRSYLSVLNMCDFLSHIILKMPKSSVYLVSDGEYISSSEFFTILKVALEKQSHFFWVPSFFMKICMLALTKKNLYHGVYSSLEVDIKNTINELGWRPVFTTKESIMLEFKTK